MSKDRRCSLVAMRRGIVVGTALASMALLATSCGSSHQVPSLPGLTAGKVVKLNKVVRKFVAGYTGAHPSSVTVFADGPNYVVVARGRFVMPAPGPPGAPFPSGDRFILTLNRWNLTVHGRGFNFVDTSQLGPGIRLKLGSWRSKLRL
jgi:hypothetical protein